MWQLLGRTIGMVGGALLLNQPHGLTWMVITFALLLNGLMLITVMLVKEPPQTPVTADRSPLAFFSLPLKEYPDFNWVLVSRFIINCGLYTILPFLEFFLIYAYHQGEAMAREQLAVIGLVVNLCGLAAVFPAGAAGDRFSKKRIIYFTCALSVGGGIAFALSSSPVVAVITAGVFGIGYGAFSAVDWALVCNVLPTREPAKYMGVWGFSDTLPQIVAPFLGGEIAARVTNQLGADIGYRTVIFSSVIWFILGAFFIRYVRERKANQKEC
ncbi:MAG: MFS transporter [Armatimonadetes bacterium]|nr:MFS transporter [Armatimonadota bacterium]